MSNRRYDLPPLDLMQSFEAAARHLSFTKAADELALTQSAISRQIKALEESLGVALFERQHRALVLTDEGVALHRIATDTLERLQVAFDGLRPQKQGRQIAITTTTGFAALWLIPRLQAVYVTARRYRCAAFCDGYGTQSGSHVWWMLPFATAVGIRRRKVQCRCLARRLCRCVVHRWWQVMWPR